jgi:hypothetical protein
MSMTRQPDDNHRSPGSRLPLLGLGNGAEHYQQIAPVHRFVGAAETQQPRHANRIWIFV